MNNLTPIRVGLFGASSMGRTCLEQLRARPAVTPVCFFDNDTAKWGTAVDGLPVREPSRDALADIDVVLIATMYVSEVQAQLEGLAPDVRIARNLDEVMTHTRVTAPSPTRTTATSIQATVNIVLADEGWILERCGREIETRLPYVRVSMQPDPNAGLNYYVNYSAFRERVGSGKHAAFFTHVEERSPQAAQRFFDVARQMDASVAMSDRYATRLTESGAGNVHVISPGVDLDRFRPAVRIGVVGRTYKTGRKGEDLLRAVIDEPNIEWHFTGEGWPGPSRTYRDEEMPAFYRSMDYILVPAHYEGGPMPLLEALASGTEVIAPRVGFVDHYPHIEFEAGNAEDLRRVLRSVVDIRLARRRTVEARTWDAWADAHDRLFRGLITQPVAMPAVPVASPSVSAEKPASGLRVLFALHAPESAAPVGGPSVRLPLMQQALRKYGVAVDISRDELPDPRGYDLVHVFNVWEPSAALRQLQHLRTFGVPIVFSPIFLKLQEGLWAQRAVLPLFKQRLTDAALEQALAQAAAIPMDIREATGLTIDATWEQWPARVREMTALADHLIVLSEHEASALQAFGALGHAVSLVHNGTDYTWAEGASAELFAQKFGVRDYVLCVGRIEPRKNQLLLARALHDTTLDLVLIGDTPKPDYADLVRRHGGRVHFIPRMTHDDPLLRSAFVGARVFALPSWSEGAPLSALEAAGFGLPMVLSDRSGEREYFRDLARYVDPLDPGAIRAAVLAAFDQSREPEAHRNASRAWISRALTWDDNARETAQAYARVLVARSAGNALPSGFTEPAARGLEIGGELDPGSFPDGTFDEVISHGAIERLSWRDVKPALREWKRVLKPGGKLHVRCQDFEYLCRQYLARRDDRNLDPALANEAGQYLGGYDPATWAITRMFGGQDSQENVHKAMLDEDVLTRLLHETGFTRIERREPFAVLHLQGTRTHAFQTESAAIRTTNAEPGAEAAAQPPALLWDSPTFSYGGYAALSRHLMRALVPAGVPVQLRTRDDDESMRKDCLASAREGWLWGRTLRRKVSGGVYVCSYTPADWNGTSIFQSRRDEHPGFASYVGLTMFETDRLPRGWREGCEAFDEIWVPSHFNRETFSQAGIPAQKIQVIPIGIDASRYDPDTVTPLEIEGRRGFTFLSVFDWTLRKGWDLLLRAYARNFSTDDEVTLVLRTAKRGSGPGTTALVGNFLATLGDRAQQPRVVVLEQPLDEDVMPRLYRAADAFVLPTRGEGWGLPIMEAMAASLPVIATRWSAHLDFANDDTAYLIDNLGTVPIDNDQNRPSPFYGPEHRWANPSLDHLASLMRRVYDNRDEARRRGAAARESIRTGWTKERTAAWVIERLARLAPAPSSGMDLGQRAEKAGRLEDALRHYVAAAHLQQGSMLPVYHHAQVLKRLGRRGPARSLFEQVGREGNTAALRGGAWFLAGQLAFEEGQLEAAANAIALCLNEMPDETRARAWQAYLQGRLEERAQRIASARDAYRTAHELAGTWELATYSLASSLKRLAQVDEAIALFRDVARTATEAGLRAGAHFHIGEMLASLGKRSEAIGHLESCLIEKQTHEAAARLLSDLQPAGSGRERSVA